MRAIPYGPAVGFLIAAALLPARAEPFNTELSAKLDAVIREEARNGFSGAVLVARGRHLLLNHAYGEERGVAVHAASRFWVASIAKQFTAAAILKCSEEGLLTLDDAISRFLPDAPTDKRDITIRQLLAHLSGLAQDYASEGQPNRTTAVRRMLAAPLIERPGQKFHYSNNNYQLAAAVVEVVTGETYGDFARRALFMPAGLRNTGYAPPLNGVSPARGERPRRLSARDWGGGERAYSTIHDLHDWYRALRRGRVLGANSIEVMLAPATPIGEGYTALGWFVGRTIRGNATLFVRGNEDWGPNGLLYAYPKSDTLIVVLSHAGDANNELSWSRFILAKLEATLAL